MSLRHRIGALLYDWPRFARAMRGGRGSWTRFRNRSERLSVDPATGGARCEWRFTSDLHICNVYPSTGLRLMRRVLAEWPIELAAAPRVSGEPRASFIIGHRGEARLPHLLKTVASIAAQRDAAVECIVVEQAAHPVARPHLPSWVRHIHTPIESDAQPYNRSWTLNVGANAARSSLLILHDNDFLVPSAYAAELLRRHAEGWEIIDPKRFMFYLTAEETQRVLRSDRFVAAVPPERVTQNLLGGGSVAADRDAYFAIGGFDEAFVGWGGEDNDFWDRAQTRRVFAYATMPLVHLWHAPQPEKVAARPIGGRQRLVEINDIPIEERIARLRERPSGRIEGPAL
jgi:hypothetical protein